MVVTLLACVTFMSAYDFEVDGIYYDKEGEGEVSVTKGDVPYSGEITIPSMVEFESTTYTVTSISEKAFFLCSELKSLSIPNTITSIGDRAFQACLGLTSLQIPQNVVSIGEGAFMDCIELKSVNLPGGITCIADSLFAFSANITSISIPDGVTSIGKGAVRNCLNLVDISIPNSVTTIGNGAFKWCGMKSVALPSHVACIEDETFSCCPNLTSISIPEGVRTIGKNAFMQCLNLISVTLPDGLTRIDDFAFTRCTSLTSVTIPASVSHIGDYVFLSDYSLKSIVIDTQNPYYDSRDNCNAIIETVSNTLIAGCGNSTVPKGVVIIKDSAFEDCQNLASIAIPESVTSIGNRAFWQCVNLVSISLSEGLVSIGELAFTNCQKLRYVIIPNSVTSIGDHAFENCSALSSFVFPDQIENMGNCVLWNCSNISSAITLPEGMTSIGNNFFNCCKNVPYISIPSSVTRIDTLAFYACFSLTSVVLPDKVTSIGEWAFGECRKLTSIFIPEGVVSIEDGAFSNCKSLPTISIPSTVTSLGQRVFWDCEKLTLVTCNATTPPRIADNTFMKYGTLRVPAGCKESYAAADYWNNFDIVEDVGVVGVGNREFEDSIDEGFSNRFVFSLQDNVLSINGYYTGNPDVTTSIEYTIIGHDIFLNMVSEPGNNVVEMKPLTLDVAIEGCYEDYYFIFLSGYSGRTAIVNDYTLHETSFRGYGVRGFVREKPPKTDISTGQKDPKESSDVDVVCRVRGMVGGGYQQRLRSKDGRVISLDGTYSSQAEGGEDVVATTSLGQLEPGEYHLVLNVTDVDDVMPPFSASLTFVVGPTGVEVLSADEAVNVIFDLQGNRVNHQAEGIYIKNGKKVLIR